MHVHMSKCGSLEEELENLGFLASYKNVCTLHDSRCLSSLINYWSDIVQST